LKIGCGEDLLKFVHNYQPVKFFTTPNSESRVNTCAADHMVPGLVHMGDEIRRVGKPYRNFMFVIGPYMSNYMDAASKDKVQLGDPAKGELMISEGAADYVPPTKMEDWPWPYHYIPPPTK